MLIRVSTPPGFEEIQRNELSRLFGRLVGIRLVAIPIAFLVAVAIAVLDPARWRIAALAVLFATVGTYFVSEAIRYRRSGFRREAVLWNLLATIAAQFTVCLVTGALESPLIVIFVPLALMIGIFGPARSWWALVVAQLVAIWAMAVIELAHVIPDLNLAFFGGGPRAGHSNAHLVTTGVVLSIVVAVGSRAGRGVRKTFDAMLAQALVAQQDTLRSHAERGEELTALSGEIAHELKNPLASVKGLAGLLSEALPAGKPAERLGVLRREVDRMQGILDEFLNFSRPLVPLTLDRLDLRYLAEEVVALHEGMAQQRGVRVELRGGGAAPARCDGRKVKQILVNLIQNALDATAPGGAIEVEVGTDGGMVQAVVLDRGAGVDSRVEGRVFDAGVTTKGSGSGLGLTIARALARQHGGEVQLQARTGGGCAARLVLPIDGPSEPAP